MIDTTAFNIVIPVSWLWHSRSQVYEKVEMYALHFLQMYEVLWIWSWATNLLKAMLDLFHQISGQKIELYYFHTNAFNIGLCSYA